MLAALTASGQRLNPTDSIKIPVQDALKVLAAADSAKVLKMHVAILQAEKVLQDNRIFEISQARDRYRQADSTSQLQLTLSQSQMKIMEDQKKIAATYIAGLEKLYRKQKRKTWFTAAAGIATTIAGILIFK